MRRSGGLGCRSRARAGARRTLRRRSAPRRAGAHHHGVARRERAAAEPLGDDALRERVYAVIRAGNPRVQACVQRPLRTVPSLVGRWDLLFTLGHDGVPRDVRVVGAERSDPALEQCIAAVAATWRFPPSDAARSVRMPYVLSGGRAPRNAPAVAWWRASPR